MFSDYLDKLRHVPIKKGVYVATMYRIPDTDKYIRVFFHLKLCREKHFVAFPDFIWKHKPHYHMQTRPFKMTYKDFEKLKNSGMIKLPVEVDFDKYLFEPEVNLYYFRKLTDIYDSWVNHNTLIYSYISSLSKEEQLSHEFAFL